MKWQTLGVSFQDGECRGGRWDDCSGERSERIESNGASGMYRTRQSLDDGSGGELGQAR